MNHLEHTIEQSYRYCHVVARRSGSSFYPCFVVLPKPQRRAMEAIYAFMRHTDDMGDRPPAPDCPSDARLDELAGWRAALDRALSDAPDAPTGSSTDATSSAACCPPPAAYCLLSAVRCLPAVVDAVRRYAIPPEHLRAVIDGVAMDLRGQSYETFDQLAEYCHRVASAVGLACIHVWGFRGAEAIEYARSCGLAVQLTNILRDLAEDAALGRIYLPQEDLHRCGYSAEALRRGESDEPFMRLMNLEIGRARVFYHEGARLYDHLEPAGRRILGLMLGVYYRLLAKIEREPAAVFARRVRLSRVERLRLAGRWLLLPASRRVLP